MAVGGQISSETHGCSWVGSFWKDKFYKCLVSLIRSKKHRHSKISTPTTHAVFKSEISRDTKDFKSTANGKNGIEPKIIDELEKRRVGLELKQAVTHIHFGSADRKLEAATQIERIAKSNTKMKEILASLGVILALVDMLDSSVHEHQLAALQAVMELCYENYTNKGLFVKASGVQKLAKLYENCNMEMKEKIAIALLSISALYRNKPMIGSCAALPTLICMMKSEIENVRMVSLEALYKLSACLENVDAMVRMGAIEPLLNMVQSPQTAERSLSILANLMLTKEGRIKMDGSLLKMPKCLIDILKSESSNSKCQERAVYILMVLAHGSFSQRQAMLQARIVPVLLEVSLLGTTLAQKRALRILHYLRGDRQSGITGGLSGPMEGRTWNRSTVISSSDHNNIAQMKEQKRAVKTMVQQSLHLNMERIIRRANMSGESSARFKSLMSSSSSKSLPY